MKYKIERAEKKTTQQGKPFIKATIKDEEAQVVEDVLIWSDFPDFERISVRERKQKELFEQAPEVSKI
jgi:hypothetical protein